MQFERPYMKMRSKGHLFVLSAPSGTGKTSLLWQLQEYDENLCVSVSHTTRKPRASEVDGQSYNFVDEDTFGRMIEEGAFLEYAEIFGYRYGTSRAWVEERLAQGLDVVLEIDYQGARSVRSRTSEVCSIFVLPPSYQELCARLHGRESEKALIEQRLELAYEEISCASEYDYLVINDDYQAALLEVQSIITSRRLEYRQSVQVYEAFLKTLTDAVASR